jgi:hypothetical protein
MRVLLDDQPIATETPGIAQAIDAARAAADEAGRIIIEVTGDGQSLESAVLDAPPTDPAGIGELRFVTADPGAFVAVTLSDTKSLLDEAAASHQEAADELMAGNRDGAIDPLRGALESWAVVRDVIEKSSALLAIDPRTIESKAGTGAVIIDGLTEKLGEIKQALSTQDDSALADVLAYDMPEQVERWRGLLGALEQTAAESRA